MDKFGECIVLDTMNTRFGNRVDLAMERSEYDWAIRFRLGMQRRNVMRHQGVRSVLLALSLPVKKVEKGTVTICLLLKQ